ncbi:hypothetical protein EX30DRAFT_66246 [Ascodesmis nigricans]|uniref:histone acetyltransferase n=1 Tax=Ascodesmis nigricans TaxID=341454 RepID=A0A4S2MUQ5_9PEZI|nr:hypothetical protein EX30DRAFT_66246 [Ascodesmis nigricans]
MTSSTSSPLRDPLHSTPRTRSRRAVLPKFSSTPAVSPDSPVDVNAEPVHELTHVVLGNHVMKPVYPHSYPRRPMGNASISGFLFVCQYCFKYTIDIDHAAGHSRYCELSRTDTLGDVVFKNDKYTIHELDGEEHLFCQNLSLLAKMFLETKSVCYGVDSFLFYMLVRRDPDSGKQCIVGFFSKEKMSWHNYNLACILVFPPYQRLGLGKLLIAFSYELSRRHGSIGSPETPLSDLGLKGYCSYWTYAIARVLLKLNQPTITINQLSKATCIHPDDILYSLRITGWVVCGPGKTVTLQVLPTALKNHADRLKFEEVPMQILNEITFSTGEDEVDQ